MENPVQMFDDIVVPGADHAITGGHIACGRDASLRGFRVLAAVELDNQAPLTTDKVDVVVFDRLLASEFEAAASATAKARPQRLFDRRERAPQ